MNGKKVVPSSATLKMRTYFQVPQFPYHLNVYPLFKKYLTTYSWKC